MPSSVLVYTTTTPSPGRPIVVDDRPHVRCRVCGYERPVGTPCGEPCV